MKMLTDLHNYVEQLLFEVMKDHLLFEYSCVAVTEFFYAHPGIILEFMPKIASKLGATLKGKNLLSERANSFFKERPLW